MRTTVDLPDGVLRRAKARAAQRGESLKTLLARAVVSELGSDQAAAEARRPVTLPLFGGTRGPRVRITGEDVARALADADAEVVAATARQRR